MIFIIYYIEDGLFFFLFRSACFSVSPSFGFLSLPDIYFIITFPIAVVVFVYILLHSYGDTNVFVSLAQLFACVPYSQLI